MSVLRRWAVPVTGLLAAMSLAALDAPAAHAFNGPRSGGSPANCGGTTVYKDDGTTWQCTFDDEFNASRIDTTKWSVPTDFLSGDVTAMYSCTQAKNSLESEANSALHLTMSYLNTPVQCNSAYPATHWVGGMVTTAHLFSQTYGRFEARIRAQANVTGGFNENFWLFPDDRYVAWNWPSTGEIDPSQQFSWYPNSDYPALHYGNDAQTMGTTIQDCPAQRGVWNTYDLIWTPTSITFQINGATCLVNTAADPAFNNPFWINLTEGLFLADSTTKGPATMDVDYVRVWK